MLLCVKLTTCSNAHFRALTDTSPIDNITSTSDYGAIFVSMPRFCLNFNIRVFIGPVDALEDAVIGMVTPSLLGIDPLTMLCFA